MVILTVLFSEQYKLWRSLLRSFLHSPASLSLSLAYVQVITSATCTQAPPVRAILAMSLAKLNIYTQHCHTVF